MVIREQSTNGGPLEAVWEHAGVPAMKASGNLDPDERVCVAEVAEADEREDALGDRVWLH